MLLNSQSVSIAKAITQQTLSSFSEKELPLDSLFFLSRVSYLEEKRLIVAEFQNNNARRSESFVFFPCVLVQCSVETEPIIRQLVNSFGCKKFRIEKPNASVLKVSARSFSDLKRFCTLVSSAIKLQPLLLNPERQFLLSRNWNYFGAFVFDSCRIEKKDSFAVLPRVSFDWLGGNLESEIQLLLKTDRVVGEKILSSIVLANVLGIPLKDVPEQKQAVAELFLEAACFRNNFALAKSLDLETAPNRFSFYTGSWEEFAQLDFSKSWPAVFAKDFFNLGFETIDCDCCVPETAFEQNVLPSSMVKVKFKKNGFFFDSKTESFALKFNATHEKKDSRLIRQKEFFLPLPPIGPFNEKEEATIPIEDAIELQKNNNIEIIDATTDLHWFCTQKESFLGKEFLALARRVVLFSECLEQKRLLALKQHGVFSENALLSDPEAVFQQNAINALSCLLESIPFHLLSQNSRFYNKQLAEAFLTIQSVLLKQFKQFSNSKGSKALPLNGAKCLVSSENALALSKEFCRQSRLPLPGIV